MKIIRHGAPDNEEETLEAVQDGAQEDQISSLPNPISNIPSHILNDILSRLSVKDIFACRCVCRTWLKLLLDSLFANLHFTRAPICPLVRPMCTNRRTPLSESLYLVELERNPSFHIGNRRFSGNACGCASDYTCFCASICDLHFKMKPNTKFMVPELSLKPKSRAPSLLKGRELQMVNSCNGLLCLCESNYGNLVMIYNPITGEYITLPKAEKDKYSRALALGFGFSPKSNQYKVLKMAQQVIEEDKYGWYPYAWVAKVITVGTGVWRSIDAPCFMHHRSAVFLNGSLHWLCGQGLMRDPLSVVIFDIDSEQFRLVAPPPPYSSTEPRKNMSAISLGVLDGCLCIFDASSYSRIDIWVMKEYGVPESWINMGLTQPINYPTNGDLSMYHVERAIVSFDGLRDEIPSTFEAVAHIPRIVTIKDALKGVNMKVLNGNLSMYDVENAIISYDRLWDKHLDIYGIPLTFDVVAYTPSFVPLQDALKVDNMKVLNVRSRPAECKPPEAMGMVPPESDPDVSTESSEEEDWDSE